VRQKLSDSVKAFKRYEQECALALFFPRCIFMSCSGEVSTLDLLTSKANDPQCRSGRLVEKLSFTYCMLIQELRQIISCPHIS